MIKKEQNLLVEVLKAIELEQKGKKSKENTLDSNIESEELFNLDDSEMRFDYFTNSTDKQMNYSEMFSYLNSESKENPYLSYESVSEEKKQEEEAEVQETISYEEVDEVIKTKKFNDMLSRSELFQMSPSVKERFDWFKVFNQAYLALLYDMV